MKKIAIALVLCLSVAAIKAQETPQPPAPPKLTKEERQAMKAKKEADLLEAFTKVGLDAEKQKKAKEIIEDANEKSKVIKGDTKLTEDEKKAKRDEINKEKNKQLKELMGEDKYKEFQKIQKAQREASMPAVAPPPAKE